ncbi:ubiquitin-specific protease [Trifolium repens]|nr:ubiquitin-specific protease [Trifolium repens]
MEHGRSSVEKYEKFTWKIENFSRFQIGQEIYSEPFVLGGYPWRISLYPSGDDLGGFNNIIWLYSISLIVT